MVDCYYYCKCFLTENYFAKCIESHVIFNDKNSFLRDYAQVNKRVNPMH